MKKNLTAFLPAALLGILLACIGLLPKQQGLTEPSISADLPLEYELSGWDGDKVQESKAERKILAADTRFSKAKYTLLQRVPWERLTPAVEVSIVYSGREMNNSIHRPEVCLPSQGHLNVQGKECTLELANGKIIKMTRLSSKLPIQNVLRAVLIANSNILNSAAAENDKVNEFAEAIKYAAIVLTTVPVLCIYPFLPRYFVKGVMIGAVKG